MCGGDDGGGSPQKRKKAGNFFLSVDARTNGNSGEEPQENQTTLKEKSPGGTIISFQFSSVQLINQTGSGSEFGVFSFFLSLSLSIH